MLIKIIDFGYKKGPERAHYNDAGADVFALNDYIINPNETKAIPLGLGLEIPDGYVGFIMPKSGLSKNGIVSEMAPIDSGYRGEIHAILTNNFDIKYKISEGDKIGQIVIFPLVLATFIDDFPKDFRDTGAFGSTGK